MLIKRVERIAQLHIVLLYTPASSVRESVREAILGGNYFRRLWTMQENMLSSDCIVVCGNVEIPWAIFVDTVGPYAAQHEDVVLAIRTRGGLMTIINTLSRLSKLIKEDVEGRLEQYWEITLANTKAKLMTDGAIISLVTHTIPSLMASNPRDKIYGIFSVF
jgi:hypothetical protein